jgi:hypothetical protein
MTYTIPLSDSNGTGGGGGSVSIALNANNVLASGSVGAPGPGLRYRVVYFGASARPNNTGIVEVYGAVFPDFVYAMTLSPGKAQQIIIPEPGFPLGVNNRLTFNYQSTVVSPPFQVVDLWMTLFQDDVT